jgi:hypothetical protein
MYCSNPLGSGFGRGGNKDKGCVCGGVTVGCHHFPTIIIVLLVMIGLSEAMEYFECLPVAWVPKGERHKKREG